MRASHWLLSTKSHPPIPHHSWTSARALPSASTPALLTVCVGVRSTTTHRPVTWQLDVLGHGQHVGEAYYVRPDCDSALGPSVWRRGDRFGHGLSTATYSPRVAQCRSTSVCLQAANDQFQFAAPVKESEREKGSVIGCRIHCRRMDTRIHLDAR